MVDPLYLQIAADLRTSVMAGKLANGTNPAGQDPQAQFSRGAGVRDSGNTIRAVIEPAAVANPIARRPGGGTFATERIELFLTVPAAARNLVVCSPDTVPGSPGDLS